MKLDFFKKAARPAMLWGIVFLLVALTTLTGALEAVSPGVGARFAEGARLYLAALPEAFWTFSGACFGVYALARSFGQDKKAEAADTYAEIARQQKGQEDG